MYSYHINSGNIGHKNKRDQSDKFVFVDTFYLLSKTINNYKELIRRSPMQTKKSQREGKRLMLETRFTEFPASSVGPRVGISRSASETDI